MFNVYDNAFSFAYTAHAGQFRRDGVTPAIHHPRDVVFHLKRRGVTFDQTLAIAWLHDVLEDTTRTVPDLLAEGFPSFVVLSVETLTKRDGESYKAYLDRVAANPIAAQVKISDMICNLADSPTEAQIAKYAYGLHRLSHYNHA